MRSSLPARSSRAVSLLLSVGVVLVPTLAAACGDAEEGAPATMETAELPELDACDLFTAEDASAVLGVSASTPEGWRQMDNRDEQAGVALSNCMYADAEGRRTAHVLVTHSVRGGYPTSWDELRESAESGSGVSGELGMGIVDSSEPASVGGQFAYWTPDLGTLTVFADERWTVAVTVDPPTRGDLAAARSAAEQTAERVLDRL